MKSKLSVGVCVLISLALVLFGLLYGTISGFSDDRQQVTALLEGENGLMDVLSYRGADGLNLCVVARRHISGSASLETLQTVSTALGGGKLGLAAMKDANDRLDEAVSAVAAELRLSQSFLSSQRDQKYLTMLESDLQNLSQKAGNMKYDDAAREFNQRLEGSLMGKLAGLLGVKPCELYE